MASPGGRWILIANVLLAYALCEFLKVLAEQGDDALMSVDHGSVNKWLSVIHDVIYTDRRLSLMAELGEEFQ